MDDGSLKQPKALEGGAKVRLVRSVRAYFPTSFRLYARGLFRLSLDTKLILHAHGPRICDLSDPPPIKSTSTLDCQQCQRAQLTTALLSCRR